MNLKYLTSIAFLFLAILLTNTTSAAPSTGNITVAFIMSGFEDQDFQSDHDQDYFEDIAFASSNSMWDYFDEVSEGSLNIEGEVFGPYTLDGDAADYSSGSDFVKDSVLIVILGQCADQISSLSPVDSPPGPE